MRRPRRVPGSEVGIALAKDGITAYCNRRALRSLASHLKWLAQSPPSEHYDFHLVWHMANHWGKSPGVFLLLDDTLRKVYPGRGIDPGFELTIMAMPDHDLRSMRPRRGRRGRLPTAAKHAASVGGLPKNQLQRTRSAMAGRRGPRP